MPLVVDLLSSDGPLPSPALDPPRCSPDIEILSDTASSAIDDADSDLSDDIIQPSQRANGLSDRTRALLASLDVPAAPAAKRRKVSEDDSLDTNTGKRKSKGHDKLQENETVTRKSKGHADDRGRSTRKDKSRQGQLNDREAKRQEREAAKQTKAERLLVQKEQKRANKEAKAEEKRRAAEIAEVNKAKLDKKDSTPEMIVDLPLSLDGTSVDRQAREFLKNLSVDVCPYRSSAPNVIKWRRKVKARWKEESQSWWPLGKTVIDDERHILCLLSAEDFIGIVQEIDGVKLEDHVKRVKATIRESIPIYLIEGLQAWIRKNRNAENRAYQARVAETNEAPKRKGHVHVELNEEKMEEVLLQLQVFHNCFVHHTNHALESAEWIANYTQHISTIPYRLQRMNLDTAVCIDTGQVKTGEDKTDTFVKMLQEIVRVTPSIAMGITAEFASVTSLIKGFEKHGPTMLEDSQKMANRNGAVTDRKIGPAISRRLHRAFSSLDPSLLDI